MRKQISVTNPKVLEYFEQQDNVSKYIERAVLQYEDFKEHDYVTRQEVLELISGFHRATVKVTTNDIDSILKL